MDRHADVEITVGSVDSKIADNGSMLPGVGDAGDRLFGMPMTDDDGALVHPSKRRKMSGI